MTLRDLTIAKKCRKGDASGRNKQGSYWIAFKEITAGYGGDGIGQSAANIDWYLELIHYRTGSTAETKEKGDVIARMHRNSWHQNDGTDNKYITVQEVLEMPTIEDVLDYLAAFGEDGDWNERVYVDSYHRENMTKALEEYGLGHAKAPDEV